MPTPYFSIRISINPLDDFDAGGGRDEQSIKLTIARQTDRDTSNTSDIRDAEISDETNVVETVYQALKWLSGNAPAKNPVGFLDHLFAILAGDNLAAIEEILTGKAEDTDDDFHDMIDRVAAVSKKHRYKPVATVARKQKSAKKP